MTPGGDVLPRRVPLDDHDVHVWVVPLDDPDKQRRRELAHLAQGMLLASYLGRTPAMLEFERGPGGKPQLRGEPLQYNLSHSDRIALVAVTRDRAVGVDVQGPHPTAAKPWFARRICSPREYEHFGGAPEPADLLRLWARKEAAIKARGEGSYVAVGEIDVLDDRLEGGWICRDVALPQVPGFHAAVVVAPASAGSGERTAGHGERTAGLEPVGGIELTLRWFSWDPGAQSSSA